MSGRAEVYRPLAEGRSSARLPASDRQSGLAVTSTPGQTGCAVPAPNGGPPCPTGGKPSVDGPGSSPGEVAVGLRYGCNRDQFARNSAGAADMLTGPVSILTSYALNDGHNLRNAVTRSIRKGAGVLDARQYASSCGSGCSLSTCPSRPTAASTERRSLSAINGSSPRAGTSGAASRTAWKRLVRRLRAAMSSGTPSTRCSGHYNGRRPRSTQALSTC